MKPVILAVVLIGCPLLVSAKSSANFYELRGKAFTLVQNAKRCESCTMYKPSDFVRGSFITKRPLRANLKDENISPELLSFNFTDGHNRISSENSMSRKASFAIWTNNKGEITDYAVTVEQVLPTEEKSLGRLNAITMINVGGNRGEIAFSNVICQDPGPTTAEPNKADVCRGNRLDSRSSRAERAPPTKAMVTPLLLQAPSNTQANTTATDREIGKTPPKP